MASYYVIPATGNDSNDGLTRATAWKTMGKFITTAASGSTFIGDGIFLGANLAAGGGSNQVRLAAAASFTFQSLTPYSCIFASTVGSTYLFRTENGIGSSTITVNDIIMGGTAYGGGKVTTPLHFGQTTGTPTIIFNGTQFTEPCIAGGGNRSFDFAQDMTGSVTFNQCEWLWNTLSITQTNAQFYTGLGIAGTIIFNDPVITATNLTHGTYAFMDLRRHSGTAQLEVNRPQITLQTTSGSGTLEAVRILNCDNAKITGPGFVAMTTTTASGTSATFSPAHIDCDSGTLTAVNGLIEGINTSVDGDGGYLALIGHDGTTAGDGRVSGVIKNVNGTGSARHQTGVGHGLMLGFCAANSFIAGGSVNMADIGALIKDSTGCFGVGTILRNISSRYLYHKANVSCGFINNFVYMGGTFGQGIGENASADGAVNNATSFFQGNSIQLHGTVGQALVIDTAQDVTAASDTFYDATYTFAGFAGSYLGTNYNTLAALLAVIDTTAQVKTGPMPSPIPLPTGPFLQIAPNLVIAI